MSLAFLVLYLWTAGVSASESIGPSVGGYPVKPVPDWVRPVPAFTTEPGRSVGSLPSRQALLRDFQFDGRVPGKAQQFNASETRLNDIHAIENLSGFRISFNPAFQQFQLHEVRVLRNGQVLDRLSSLTLHPLSGPDEPSTDGRSPVLTLNLKPQDLVAGDIVRVAWSIIGENPVYGGLRELAIHTELWQPLLRNHARILTGSDRTFSRRVRGLDVPFQLREENGRVELILDQRDVPVLQLEADVPTWRQDRGTVVLSDAVDWQSVVNWILPMVALPEQSDERIRLMASVIRQSRQAPAERIAAALRWVQQEIETIPVALVASLDPSRLPSRRLQQVLETRQGSPLDKSLLLMALLRELGVEAQPALVNRRRGLESANYPHRLHAFDHVLVHVRLGDVVHYIDPGLRYQAGSLGQLHEPDHGRALVLAADTTALSIMGNARVANRLIVHHTLLPVENDAELAVEIERQGLLAERLRHFLDTQGELAMVRKRQQSLSQEFLQILPSREIQVQAPAGNSVMVHEHYRISDLWQGSQSPERHRRLSAAHILSHLPVPDQVSPRHQAYRLDPTIDIVERWDIVRTLPLQLDESVAEIGNRWFSFSRQVEAMDSRNLFRVGFRLKVHADEVAAEDMSDYLAAVEQLRQLAVIDVREQPSLGAAVRVAADEVVQSGAIRLPLILLMLAVLSVRCLRKPLQVSGFRG